MALNVNDEEKFDEDLIYLLILAFARSNLNILVEFGFNNKYSRRKKRFLTIGLWSLLTYFQTTFGYHLFFL